VQIVERACERRMREEKREPMSGQVICDEVRGDIQKRSKLRCADGLKMVIGCVGIESDEERKSCSTNKWHHTQAKYGLISNSTNHSNVKKHKDKLYLNESV
jgi:hypothetical protein